jgi:16S rRNA processing protein RimM
LPHRPGWADATLSPHRGERGFAVAPGGDLVLLGEFGRAHGLNGEVRVKSFTAEPSAIAGYGAFVDGRGQPIVLASVRPAGGTAPDMLIARVAGVTTREAAESLNGSPLFIPRERLPAPDADEFFLADLIGLAVEDTEGQPLGTVVAVPNYGAGDLLEIAPRDGGPSALLPFTQAFAPVVDVPGRRIVVDPPAYLFAPAADASGPEQP